MPAPELRPRLDQRSCAGVEPAWSRLATHEEHMMRVERVRVEVVEPVGELKREIFCAGKPAGRGPAPPPQYLPAASRSRHVQDPREAVGHHLARPQELVALLLRDLDSVGAQDSLLLPDSPAPVPTLGYLGALVDPELERRSAADAAEKRRVRKLGSSLNSSQNARQSRVWRPWSSSRSSPESARSLSAGKRCWKRASMASTSAYSAASGRRGFFRGGRGRLRRGSARRRAYPKEIRGVDLERNEREGPARRIRTTAPSRIIVEIVGIERADGHVALG